MNEDLRTFRKDLISIKLIDYIQVFLKALSLFSLHEKRFDFNQTYRLISIKLIDYIITSLLKC